MNEWLYSDIVKEHFLKPKNIWDDEEDFKEDGKGLIGNIKCGDQMLMAIQVRDGKIADCRWKTYGCASAIASVSILSEMVKGKTLEEAYKITPKEIVSYLGGLPDHKIHCSVLGDKALRAAIDDYFTRNGMADRIQAEPAEVICTCMNITDKDIEEAVKNGARTYEELQNRTKIGTVCGQCKEKSEEILHQYVHIYGE